MTARELASLSKKAKTATEHERVAKLFELQALAHEAEADAMASRKDSIPMAHKWPAMVQGPIDLERGKAAEARAKAAMHRRLGAG